MEVTIMKDSKNKVEFTEVENKIRKRWLFLSSIPSVVGGILCIFSILFSSDFMDPLAFLGLVPILLIGFYINYYCAYKNPGTILLLLIMIGLTLTLFKEFLSFFDPQNIAFIKIPLGYSLITLAFSSYPIALFYYSYKLRKINKKMKEKRLMVYALSDFSAATSLEELNEQFARRKISYDSKIQIKVLTEAYDQHKSRLTLANESFE
jgi:hypothetical protein